MQRQQSWVDCDTAIKQYVLGFVDLLKCKLDKQLVGVYLHGSLAMGSYFPPKSDIDIVAIVANKLSAALAESLNIDIAHYSDKRPSTGDIEFSVITTDTAITAPTKMPYEIHYSSMWHDKILNYQVVYGEEQYDSDLSAHLMCIKKRGVCLCGRPIAETFGDINWDDFMFAILDDLDWILADENICESPYYCTLNICRVFQLLTENTKQCFSKNEGGKWGIVHLPKEYKPLIEQALSIYRSDRPIDESNRKTGGVLWDRTTLIEFRDYARSFLKESNRSRGETNA